MPDKLTKQTVYVPVSVSENLPKGNKAIPVVYSTGGYDTLKPTNISYRPAITHWLDRREGVYPLTGNELADLLTEYEESLHGNSTSFLKEKGVEI